MTDDPELCSSTRQFEGPFCDNDKTRHAHNTERLRKAGEMTDPDMFSASGKLAYEEACDELAECKALLARVADQISNAPMYLGADIDGNLVYEAVAATLLAHDCERLAK